MTERAGVEIRRGVVEPKRRADACADASTRKTCAIEFGGAGLELLPERAIWWATERALLAADLHLGKPASFRAAGAPVPEAVTAADLDRLSRLVDMYGAARLVVLGDLAHDETAWETATMRSLVEWRARHAELEIVLVRGNHDLRASDPPAELRIEVVDPGWEMAGIEMHHDPATVPDGAYSLCGHIHPGVHLRDPARRSRPGTGLRAPCFWFTQNRGVLPAFGAFTGLQVIQVCHGERIFATGIDRVLEVVGVYATT